MIPLPAVRAALDSVGHPALFLVDTISSLGSLEFRMDDWGVDCVVGGSQKGLMLPTGMSFTGVSEKGMKAHRVAGLKRYYFDWTLMEKRAQKSFIGTLPVNMFYGLRESVRLLEEEGLDNVVSRHHRLAEATRRAVKVWSGNNGPQLFCVSPDRYSDSVTAILMPEGYDAEAVRRCARWKFNVSLGGGLGALGGKVFRIGHLGDLNEPMLLGALAAVEMALRIEGVPHGRGGVDAAMDYLAE
jgi:alanine-glyoxylate transaminase/serine-glyoxylate transaminase/serine-pyruvate transaminase